MLVAPDPPRCGEPGILLPSINIKVLEDPSPRILIVALLIAALPAVGPEDPKELYMDCLRTSAAIKPDEASISSLVITVTCAALFKESLFILEPVITTSSTFSSADAS